MNSSDASLILRYAVGSASMDSQELVASDVEGNGTVHEGLFASPSDISAIRGCLNAA